MRQADFLQQYFKGYAKHADNSKGYAVLKGFITPAIEWADNYAIFGEGSLAE